MAVRQPLTACTSRTDPSLQHSDTVFRICVSRDRFLCTLFLLLIIVSAVGLHCSMCKASAGSTSSYPLPSFPICFWPFPNHVHRQLIVSVVFIQQYDSGGGPPVFVRPPASLCVTANIAAKVRSTDLSPQLGFRCRVLYLSLSSSFSPTAPAYYCCLCRCY